MQKSIGIVLALTFTLGLLTIGRSAPPPTSTAPDAAARAAGKSSADGGSRPTREQARRQAEILHDTLHTTLQTVHQRYYRENEGLPIPAAILKDVFDDLEENQRISVRWLAVDGLAMNADHKPQDQFDEAAVKALKSGQRAYERTVDGVYRRTGAIKLTNQCLKCHAPQRKSLQDQTAGLTICIPIQPD
ncbi:MAG: DUF3365 domain-containing protein [Planctomycetes bacterium]|nr:DUF3365 domain-containing protein [Planctomycetota bacterium]